MESLFEVSDALAGIYRERLGDPAFWAEPLNALTNASFLIAACFAWELSSRRNTNTRTTIVLLFLASLIGVGSFVFHTVPNYFTMWLDVIPIASFQILFLWLAGSKMLGLSLRATIALVVGVTGLSFVFFPMNQPLNGSMFYLPVFTAMLTIGLLLSRRFTHERYLLVAAAGCFALAITARTVDMMVPWAFGTHFLWHSLNGVVVYLALRTWIVFVAQTQLQQSSDTQSLIVEATGEAECVAGAG